MSPYSTRVINFFLAILSGVLLFASWPVSAFTVLIFVAWIPLLWLESRVKNRKHFFGLTYISMFTWNLATTWWIWNASAPGATAAFFANSLLMCFPWLGYKIVKDRLGEKIGLLALISFWMCFEYLHLHDWGLSWPWLTLGNAFATHPGWVQWYELTGTSGGTLWILVVNIFLFLHIRQMTLSDTPKKYKHLLVAILLLGLPLLVSVTTGSHKANPQGTRNIVVVQPNIDPYEKISAGTFETQMQKLILLSERAIDDYTALVVWPETALYTEQRLNETELKENLTLQPLWSFLQRHPFMSLFTGIESYRVFDKASSTSEEYNGMHYESYNGSVLMDSSGASSFYHKSMLVPGVETLPWFLKFLGRWFDKFGGTTAGYTQQRDRTVLQEKNGFKIAPAICYESVYGEFMSKYIKKGANLICIITNDGWWQNTPGHKQHMNYARLRAIETRIWIARSANTGISCFISPYGEVYDPVPYDTEGAIKLAIDPHDQKTTFFVRYGDILSKLMTGIAILIIVMTSINKFKKLNRKGATMQRHTDYK